MTNLLPPPAPLIPMPALPAEPTAQATPVHVEPLRPLTAPPMPLAPAPDPEPYATVPDDDSDVSRDEILSVPRHHARGIFITFEGQDGSGKTMQAAALASYLSARGHNVLSTTEPGGTDIGQLIRKIVLDNQLYVDPQAEALLFAADRAQHVNTRVIPALQRGDTVVQDRYIDSSVAYQGAGRILNPREIRDLSMWAASGLEPDLTLLLDLDPETARGRAGGTGEPLDRLEDEDHDFRSRLREGFLDIARREPSRFLIIDGDRNFADVAAEIEQKVETWLRSRS